MIQELEIKGVLLIDQKPAFLDERGFFKETFRREDFEKVLGHTFLYVQENHARSKKGVLRGIHVAPWNKMVYVPRGEVLSVLVDLRTDSPTFKKWISVKLGEENRVKLFVPSGIGNAYLVLSDMADYEYQVDQYWQPGMEVGIRWDDPELGINWSITDPILSDKDKNAPSLNELLQNR